MKRLFKWMPLAGIYMLSVLLPLLVVVYLAGSMIKSFEKNLIAERKSSIEIVFERFTQRMDNIESMAQMLSGNERVTEYVYASNWGNRNTLLESSAVSNLLQDYMINQDIETMFLYNFHANQIISAGLALKEPSMFFEISYCPIEYSEEAYMEKLKNISRQFVYSPAMKVKRLGEEIEVIEYYTPFSGEQRKDHKLQFVVVMETKQIFDGLIDVLGEDSTWQLYDHSGQLIYQRGTSAPLTNGELNHELVHDMTFTSADGDWSIRAILPEIWSKESYSSTTFPIILVMLLTILVSSTLCIVFTFRNSQYIQRLLDEEHRSKTESERYRNSYQYEILYKLLRNLTVDTHKLSGFLEQEEWQFIKERCVVICIRMTDSQYRSDTYGNVSAKDLLKERLKETLERQYVTLDISAREMVCIMSLGEDDTEIEMRNLITRLYVALSYELGIELKIAAGTPTATWKELTDSYKQAKAVLKYSGSSGEPTYLYTDLKEFYYYPKDTEEKLKGYILTGDKEDAGAILSRIYEENLGDSGTLSNVQQGIQLVQSIWNCIQAVAGTCFIPMEGKMPKMVSRDGKVAEIVSVEGKVPETITMEDVEKGFQMCLEAVDHICNEIAARSKDTQSDTVSRIHSYIMEHFCEDDMSLKKLSNRFKLNESYVSNLFKCEYGENLSSFITKLRIEKACSMIQKGDSTVSEIAAAVGYTSDDSFRRVFKKATGMTPGEYRRQQE